MVAERQRAKLKKYRVWACSFNPLTYPMEYTEVAIHKAEAKTPKNIPNWSTRNCSDTPGARDIIVNSNIFPLRIKGTMERTMENLIKEARIVQNSRKFLFLSPVKMINSEPINVTKTANNGLMETIASINTPSLNL
jgi:hypothetical protein